MSAVTANHSEPTWQSLAALMQAAWHARLRVPLELRLLLLAALYVFAIDPYYAIRYNRSASLPYRLVLIEVGTQPERGDFVAYRYHGANGLGLWQGERIFKRVVGVPGDVVCVGGTSSRLVLVSGQPVGEAKANSKDGQLLAPIAAGEIPPGHYFVAGTHVDSFDSRYAEQGLIRSTDVIGVAHPWF